MPVALVGVVGDDHPGTEAIAQAAADGIDVSAVVRRRVGAAPEDAAWAASAAAGLIVPHAGGRPELHPGALGEVLRRVRGR